MHYRFAQERPDYSDLASGRVFYSLPGHPAFPIRLASEIFQRCLAIRRPDHPDSPCTLYDPCCGTAYHLSILAYLHGPSIREVIGSDIDGKAIEVAEGNLGLLTVDGMDRRIGEISGMLARYNKESHRAAWASAQVLRGRIETLNRDHSLKTRVFQANATDGEMIRDNLKDVKADVVFADVPYGRHSRWIDPNPGQGPKNSLWSMLDALSGILSPDSVVAVASDKGQKASHEGYRRIEQFQAGKRRVVIFKPVA